MKKELPAGRLHPRLLLDPVHFFALGFGAGLSPWAPGTMGTLVAAPLIIGIGSLGSLAHLYAAILFTVIGVPLCAASARKLGRHDHPAIVWDEIAGYAITMLGAPLTYEWLLTGFVAFRILDIVKPWPIREADHRLGGGLGIMLDDVMAGVIAGLALYALNNVF